jgi:molybdopterin/thiamine biosynthesis adenylyltransferase
MDQNLFNRQIQFFGLKGQEILQQLHVAIVGVGGTGSHIAQQLAFLGVGTIAIIDDDKVEKTNKNRLIGVKSIDELGTPKVDIVERNIKHISPTTTVIKIPEPLMSVEGFEALKKTQFAFGCVDNDGARLVQNELCLAYEIPFIDVASDIFSDNSEYGGHIISILNNQSCLYCLDQIDPNEASKHLMDPAARKDWDEIYGVDKKFLGEGGPSVVSINGIVSSLAVTEFMLHVTKIREIRKFLVYKGSKGIVLEKREIPKPNCYYCQSVRGKKELANLDKYLN